MTPSPDEEPYALFIINPSFKLSGKDTFVYGHRYQGSHCTASYVAARRYAVVDIGTGKFTRSLPPICLWLQHPDRPLVFPAPCPIRAAGGAGGEEGVIAEVTLPLLKEAVGLPEGTQATAEIIGGITTLVVSAVRHVFLPDIESVETPRTHQARPCCLQLPDMCG